MQELKTLDLSRSVVTDSAFRNLPQFQHLTLVTLADTALGEGTLQWLTALPHLRQLNLAGCSISEDSTNAPWTFLQLQSIDLSRGALRKNRMARFQLPVLNTLNLDSCGLTDDDIQSIAVYPNLKSLDLSGNPLGGRGLTAVVNLPIVELRLARTHLTDRGLESLAGLSHALELLDVSETPVSGVGFRALSDVRIDGLKLCGTALTNEGIEAVCSIKNLLGLDLRRTVVPAASWPVFGRCEKLGRLSIDGDAEVLGHLCPTDLTERVQILSVSRADGSALLHLSRFPKLGIIRLESCEIDERVADVVVNATKCTWLELQACTISDEAVQVLASSGCKIQIRRGS